MTLREEAEQANQEHRGGGTALPKWRLDISREVDALAKVVVPVPTVLNKDMPASVTALDFNLACATAIASTPTGYVGVSVNGISARVGNGVKTGDCYFSHDGGITPRSFGSVVAGDLLYWVGTVAGYQLSAVDLISFFYEALSHADDPPQANRQLRYLGREHRGTHGV